MGKEGGRGKAEELGARWLVGPSTPHSFLATVDLRDPSHRDWRWLVYLEPRLPSSMQRWQPSYSAKKPS